MDVIVAPARKITGTISVRRGLPTAKRRAVGPFVFLDHMGPQTIDQVDVPPHPHIGLATVTYLFEGELIHRDSVGSMQSITPGAVNWMTAGRGIVHSERKPPRLRGKAVKFHGLQIWVALPHAFEEAEPAFAHTPAESLPVIEEKDMRVRVVLGAFHGKSSPVKVLGEMIYAVAELEKGARLPVPAIAEERAAYVAEGSVDVNGVVYPAGQMLVLAKGEEIAIQAAEKARVAIIGGPPLDGPRHIWWNFVSSSRERIEAAKADWRAQNIGHIAGETEFVPLP